MSPDGPAPAMRTGISMFGRVFEEVVVVVVLGVDEEEEEDEDEGETAEPEDDGSDAMVALVGLSCCL